MDRPARVGLGEQDGVVSADVVALGAWCDLEPPEEDDTTPGGFARASARFGWSPVPPGEARATPGGAHFRVHEFAILADGRRVTIRDDLGFSSWSRRYEDDSGKTEKLNPWDHMTRESVQHDVRKVVLPDDGDSADEHPYEWLRELLLRQGIETSVEQLRSVPYTVEFSDRPERRLRDKRPSDGE
jgi:hypothetical protein